MQEQAWWKPFLDFWNWLYDKIAYVIIAVLTVNTILFFAVVSRGYIMGILNLIALVVFALRIWKEREQE